MNDDGTIDCEIIGCLDPVTQLPRPGTQWLEVSMLSAPPQPGRRWVCDVHAADPLYQDITT